MENKFSTNLRILRKINKLTLESLGKNLGISKSALSDYENAHTFPSLDVCESICQFFGINLNDLQNSDFSEMILKQIQQNSQTRKYERKNEDKNDFNNPFKQLEF